MARETVQMPSGGMETTKPLGDMSPLYMKSWECQNERLEHTEECRVKCTILPAYTLTGASLNDFAGLRCLLSAQQRMEEGEASVVCPVDRRA